MTHDRYFLDNVAGWILELDRGRGIPWEGNYSSWLEQKQDRLVREEKAAAARQKTLARELEWIRMAPRARQAKNKARIKAYEQMSAEAFQDAARTNSKSQIPPGKQLGDLVIEAKGITKSYGDHVLIENLDFRLPPGGIVGVIGPNGAGKTTLFRMMVGTESPTLATIRSRRTPSNSATSIRTATPCPKRRRLRGNLRRTRDIEIGGRKINARAYVARFNFQGTDQQKKVGDLSGGERNRVHLAKLLRRGSTCCCWTSRRTIWTSTRCGRSRRRWLNFAGCVVVISHDRWFLDRLATHILAFEGDGLRPLVRGELPDLRRAAPRAPGNRPRRAAAFSLQEAAALKF